MVTLAEKRVKIRDPAREFLMCAPLFCTQNECFNQLSIADEGYERTLHGIVIKDQLNIFSIWKKLSFVRFTNERFHSICIAISVLITLSEYAIHRHHSSVAAVASGHIHHTEHRYVCTYFRMLFPTSLHSMILNLHIFFSSLILLSQFFEFSHCSLHRSCVGSLYSAQRQRTRAVST